MEQPFAGKVAFVTGAGSGIGAAGPRRREPRGRGAARRRRAFHGLTLLGIGPVIYSY
jgi:NAD(P)-dependent dehydrogenase (short-subunit alcohol dehydrogenase family)